MLSHILYGKAVIEHGGLRFTARAAGKRGEQVSLSITSGVTLAVNVTPKPVDATGPALAGAIAITVPAGTTQTALFNLLSASAPFKKLARVDLTGNGSLVVAPLALVNFVAGGGLRQDLQSRLEVAWWEDRDQKTTGAVKGFIFPEKITPQRISPADPSNSDYFEGVICIVVAMQGIGFEAQNVIIDQFRRALHLAVKYFAADDLQEMYASEFLYSNALKDELVNSNVDEADLKVIARFGIKWTEPAADDESFQIQSINPGLWLEPLVDSLGPGGGEVLDTQLTITDQD